MTASREGPVVVVGVDGSAEATEAARYAAGWAGRHGQSLLVVHASEPSPVRVGERDLALPRVAAEALVDGVLTQVRMPVTLPVQRRVECASPVAMLQRLARTATVVVIGEHTLTGVDHVLVGPVASPLTATAPCPVLVVPRLWSRPEMTRRYDSGRPVVVALDGETAATAALGFAFEEAQLQHLRLVALHAGSAGDELEGALLGELLAGHRQDHPDIAVSVLLVPGEPDEALLGASGRAGLMVVGRPHRSHGRRSWSHSVARSVTGRTRCPLSVVPAAAGPWLTAVSTSGRWSLGSAVRSS